MPPTTNISFGHGFYQFSPELFFRIFSIHNGFVTRVFLFEDRVGGQWFEVRDPAEMQQRGTLINRRPTYLLVMARKTANALFVTPQQSDYQAKWVGAGSKELSHSLVNRLDDSKVWRILSRIRDRIAWLLVNRHTRGMLKPH
jgi:hypothetical protein